jgi:phthalate 4,5-dioxygenase oxygenase subunit
MLSRENNEALVRVGPGTAMGTLFRLYWIPCFPSELLLADGQPKPVRLLGEDLILFRDTEGRPGLVGNACPHRGAPLMFARNEECGLRCVYHGWKFNVSGAAVDMPAEPVRSRLHEKVRLKAYKCIERNGIVWTYMGPDQHNPPPLPDLEWNLLPTQNVHVSFRVQESNWLQAVEGEIDSAHAAILHGRVDNQGAAAEWLAKKDLRPTFECFQQPFGMSIASRRKLSEDTLYWRVNQFVLPFWTLVPPQSKFPELSGHAWIPMDDTHTLCLMFSYVPAAPLYPRTRELFNEGYKGRETGHASRHAYAPKPPNTPYADFWTKFSLENSYQFDYRIQQTTMFSGLPGLWVQDSACQAGLAPIYDRTQENLGVGDTGIVMTRHFLLETLAALQQRGIKPAGVDNPETFMVRAVSLSLPAEARWAEAGRELMQARLGADFGYTP